MLNSTFIISGGSNLFAIIKIQVKNPAHRTGFSDALLIITLKMVIPSYPPLEKSVRLETEGGWGDLKFGIL